MMNLTYGIIIEDWAKMHGNLKFIIIYLGYCALGDSHIHISTIFTTFVWNNLKNILESAGFP